MCSYLINFYLTNTIGLGINYSFAYKELIIVFPFITIVFNFMGHQKLFNFFNALRRE